MIDSPKLLTDLQKEVTKLHTDLRARCDAESAVDAALKAQYDAARAGQRTALTYKAWREEELTNVAVAWVLARAFIEFWRRTDAESGRPVHDFSDPGEGGGRNGVAEPTRFLGDLYQDLSEAARKRYALLQTPVFIEQFILDRTLTPAIETFGFRVVRMIDPTCGSGHFLLGGFARFTPRGGFDSI